MKYFKMLKAEMKRLIIPTKEQVIHSTIFVLVSSVILATLITLDTNLVTFLIEKIM